MLRARTTAFTIFALTALLLPATTFASTKCLCNNGVITESMDDDSGACDDACDGMGGGREWTEEDAGYTNEGVITDTPRPEDNRGRDRVEPPADERR